MRDDRPAFGRVLRRLRAEAGHASAREYFTAYLVARDGANRDLPWSEYRVEMVKAMSAVAQAASNTPSQSVFFARFDDLIFVNVAPRL